MKYPARILYFLWLIVAIYVILPISFFIFSFVYLVWNLKWISKECLSGVTDGWQEIQITTINGQRITYKTPFHYLIRKEKK